MATIYVYRYKYYDILQIYKHKVNLRIINGRLDCTTNSFYMKDLAVFISTKSGTIMNDCLWLYRQDDVKAIELFKQYYADQINEFKELIKSLEHHKKTLDILKQSVEKDGPLQVTTFKEYTFIFDR